MQEDNTRLALLEREQENVNKEMVALREAITEISKVNIRISELLAVHQVKLDQQQKNDDDVNRKVEIGIRNLTTKMDADRKDIYDKMDEDKTELMTEIKGIRDKVYIGIGIGIILNIIVVVAVPPLIQGGLTNSHSSATMKVP